MTRLNEALERARGAATESIGSEIVPPHEPDSGQALPETWLFDLDQAPLSTPEGPTIADAPQPVPDVEHTNYPFTKIPPVAAKLVVGANPNTTLVEQFRHLAAALHHAQLQRGVRTIMIASAVQAEGKTITAANLALTLSHSHRRRVLLVDADLRRPSIHELFDLSNREGLNDALKIVTADTPLPLHKISPTLSVITAGRPTADPMSSLISDMMRQFILEASEQFDWVIIDTPPVALLSDANLLAAMIDVAVMVVGANTTPYPLVRRAVEAIGPAKILGVVLNKAKHSEVDVGYKYSYGYRYAPREQARRKRAWRLPFRRKPKS